MDLTDVLKEASIIDHEWYKNGLLNDGKPTFDPKEEGIKKRNNTKPELEIEWGGAGPDIDVDEPAGKVTRNIPKEDLADASEVILFARDQMNRGRMGKALINALKAKFDPKTLKASEAGLRKQLALQGVVGCIAVDGRGYKSCQDALKVASNSPYKRFIHYVVGCQCGDPHYIPTGANSAIGKIANSSGNSVDDFFASEAPSKTEMVSHCRSTMMPILSWRGDLDQSMTDQTMIDLGNMSGLPEGQYNKLYEDRKNEKISSNLAMVRAAFCMLNTGTERVATEKYAEKVDASEHILSQSGLDIEFGAVPMGDLDVDPVNPAIQHEFEPDAPPPSTSFEGPPSLFSELSDFDLAERQDNPEVQVELAEDGMSVDVDMPVPVSKDLNVDIQRAIPTEVNPLDRFDMDMRQREEEISFNDVSAMPDLNVDPEMAPMETDVPLFESLGDVEMEQFKETEFEGVGDIELDDEEEDEDEFDVDMRQDMRL